MAGQRQALMLEMEKSARNSNRGNQKGEAMTMEEMHQVKKNDVKIR